MTELSTNSSLTEVYANECINNQGCKLFALTNEAVTWYMSGVSIFEV